MDDAMKVQEFLKGHTLSELESAHGVKSRVCGHKVSLNYSSIEAVDSDPVSQECRGLILRKADGSAIDETSPLGDDTVVLARPFDRFFNYGQDAAADCDMISSSTRFYEKLDGTCTILYFDDILSEWHVATRAVPEADMPIDGFGEGFTFRTLFERAVLDSCGVSFGDFVSRCDESLTYLFELCTPVSRVVIAHEDFSVTLLGVRESCSGIEFDPVTVSACIECEHAEVFSFDSISELVEFVGARDGQEYEGIVVCDSDYRRVKVKSAAYVAVHRVTDLVKSPRSLLMLVLSEKFDDVISMVPEYAVGLGRGYQEKLRVLCAAHDALYLSCSDEAKGFDERALRKGFALAVQDKAHGFWMGPMMSQYTGRCSGFLGWVSSQAKSDGSWDRSFLDRLLREVG